MIGWIITVHGLAFRTVDGFESRIMVFFFIDVVDVYRLFGPLLHITSCKKIPTKSMKFRI